MVELDFKAVIYYLDVVDFYRFLFHQTWNYTRWKLYFENIISVFVFERQKNQKNGSFSQTKLEN